MNELKYLQEFDPGKCGGHERRYAQSLEWIEQLLVAGALIYDFGYGSYGGSVGEYGSGKEDWPFNAAVKRLFPVRLQATGGADLRYPIRVPGVTVDGCFVMETIEHMKDRTEDVVDTFRYSGIRNLLSEAFRILKPGGWMFLTTPNGSQYGCAWRLVKGHGANWVKDHVREFGYCEVQQFIVDAGFVVERIETKDVWETLECPAELRAVMDWLAPEVPRGDCIFILARKPEEKNGLHS